MIEIFLWIYIIGLVVWPVVLGMGVVLENYHPDHWDIVMWAIWPLIILLGLGCVLGRWIESLATK